MDFVFWVTISRGGMFVFTFLLPFFVNIIVLLLLLSITFCFRSFVAFDSGGGFKNN